MSRIGKRPIAIPEKVTVTNENGVVSVAGPHGNLSRTFRPLIDISVGEGEVTLVPKKSSKFSQALWGTYASHIQNMIEGVANGYTKKLIIEGVGYRAQVQGNTLVLTVGFSHPVEKEIPEGVTVTVEKNEITISGIDKEVVGQFASQVRDVKKPEPYKGKGIRYDGEVIRRKQGKRAVT